MGTRKPLADVPGYVCSLRAPFGFVAVLDRDAGAEVDVSSRWAVAAYDKALNRIAVVAAKTQRTARAAMKDARARGFAWLAPLVPRTGERNAALHEAPPAPPGPLSGATWTTTTALGEEVTFQLDAEGRPLPRFPHNPSYMRGWHATAHKT